MYIEQESEMIMQMKEPTQEDIDKFRNEAEHLTTKMKYVLGQVAVMSDRKNAQEVFDILKGNGDITPEDFIKHLRHLDLAYDHGRVECWDIRLKSPYHRNDKYGCPDICHGLCRNSKFRLMRIFMSWFSEADEWWSNECDD